MTTVKIPTILGLGILIIGLAVGVFLVAQSQSFLSKAGVTQQPKNVMVANLGPNSAAIYWQTDQSTPGFIQSGLTTSLGFTFKDDRDLNTPEKHTIHFVTLTGLSPDTTYYYKISSGSVLYPKNEPSTFKTTPDVSAIPHTPLIGRVLDNSLKPSEESLIVLDIPEAQGIATVTKTGGNFILPLANLKSKTLDKAYDLNVAQPLATLIVTGGLESSKVTLKLPTLNPILPPIILGRDLKVSQKAASPSGIPITPNNQAISRYDFNKDGVVNALDFAIIVDNLGKRLKNKSTDLNSDGTVDQKDLDLMTKFLNRGVSL